MTVKMAARNCEESSPTWLRRLKLGRFYRYCESHHSEVCNFYCLRCMGLAICPKCKNQHDQCGRKMILTAYKASGEATLRTEDVESIWDISDICLYIINRKHILFIQRKGRDGRRGLSHGEGRCRNCSYRIRSPSKYCSIECKVDMIQRSPATETEERKSAEETGAGVGESGAEKSYRKRPRKGIPRRAPFF
ncbi:hypothetical protein MLD38_030892 [Melastoma candidum]|uniref:Uncharacterized protein n=1 Tax=Melastoma candidum TaxID=119954 RepID=A0ACB9MRL8_9MYRT|nr:hypothetical protein MLD38_030892 [Melastoma candidum]